jgi:zinc protease
MKRLIVSIAVISLFVTGACKDKTGPVTNQPIAIPVDPDADGPPMVKVDPKPEPPKAAPTTPDAPFRQNAPAAGPATVIVPPTPKEFTLKNGLKVMLIERRELPLVSLSLMFRTGSEQNPKGKAGLASMVAAMLDEGTKTRASLVISDEIENLGMDYYANTDYDYIELGMGSVKETFDASLALFGDMLQNPIFDDKEFSRVKEERLTNLKTQKDRPATMNNNTLINVLYGPTHPYGQPEGGTEASITSMTKKDLQAFHKKHFVPTNAVLVLVGDINEADAKQKLEAQFATWKGAAPTLTKTTSIGVKPSAKVYFIEKDNAPQSAMRVALLGIERTNADYFSAQVMNAILGGIFSSRLNLNLREKHAWTYGARSGFTYRKAAGPFSASADVQSDHAIESIDETLLELARISAEEVTDEEISLAKSALAQTFIGAFESNAATASTFGRLAMFNFPTNYYESFAKNINAVTKADIQRVAKAYVRVSEMVVVIVGPKSIEEGLKKFGTVEKRDAFGKKL